MRYYTSTRLGVFKRILVWLMMLQIMSWQLLPGVMAIAEAAEGPDDALGGLTVGGQFGEEEFQAFGDILLPVLYGDDMGLLFVSPRLSVTDHEEEELNLGLGYRYLLNVSGYDVIMGANAYYDNRWTHYNNHFDQYGVGLEMLTPWVDARANWYFADEDEELINSYTESSTSTVRDWQDLYATGNTIRQHLYTTTITETRTYEQYEASMDGFDAEIGMKIPYIDRWMDTRVFVGWQDFDNPYGEDFEGAKGRLEVRALPGLTLDAEVYEDEDLNGTEYAVGARVRLPFDVAKIAQGENPFAGAAEELAFAKQKPFAARMGEMVIRDMKVRRSQSDVMENVDKRTVDKNTVHTKETLTDSATFVDGDNALGFQDGTYENPWDVINEGVSNAFGDLVVVVDDFAAAPGNTYFENVVLTPGVKMYGRYPGGGGKYLNDIRPIVDGGLGNLPTFELQGNNTLAWMHILNTGGNPASKQLNIDGNTYNVGTAGVVADGVNNINLSGLLVDGCGYGAFIARNGSLDVNVDNSQFYNSDVGDGLKVYGLGASGTFSLNVSGVTCTNNSSDGLDVNADNYDVASMSIVDSRFDNNASDGVEIDGTASTGDFSLSVVKVRAEQNGGGDGVEADLDTTNGTVRIAVSRVRANMNGNSGVELDANVYGTGGVTLSLNDVVANDNDDDNIELLGYAYSGDVLINLRDSRANRSQTDEGIRIRGAAVYGDVDLVLSGIQANDNDAGGIYAYAYSYVTGDLSLQMSDVEASNNGEDGVQITAYAYNTGDVSVRLSHVKANHNGDNPIDAYAANFGWGPLAGGNVLVSLSDVQANGNADEGIELYANTYYGNATIALNEVQANNNTNGAGIYASAWTYYGNALVSMKDVVADNNDGGGIYAYAWTLFGNSRINMVNVGPNNNNGHGIGTSAYAYVGDATVTMTGIEVNSNTNDGMWAGAYAVYGDAVISLSNIEANDNGGWGVWASANVYYYGWWWTYGIGDARVTMNNVTANRNGGYGIGAYATAVSGDATISLSDIQVNDNTGYGIWAGAYAYFYGWWAYGYGDADVTISGVQANGNGLDGVGAWAQTLYGDATTSLSDIQADGNSGWGVWTMAMAGYYSWWYGFAYGSGDAAVSVNDVQANGNGVTGVDATAYALWGDATTSISDIVADGNTWMGVYAYAYSGYYSALYGGYGGNGDATVNVNNVQANGNAAVNVGAYSWCAYGTAVTTIADIQANGSTGANGVIGQAWTYYGNATLTMNDVQANGNYGTGLVGFAYTGSWLTGWGGGAAVLSLDDIEASSNTVGAGVVAQAWAWGLYGAASISVMDTQAKSNGNVGLYAGAYSYAYDASVTLLNVGAGNNVGANVVATSRSWFGDARLRLQGVSANSSVGGDGAVLRATTYAGDAVVSVTDLEAGRNAYNGMVGYFYSTLGDVTATIRDSRLVNNMLDGLDVQMGDPDLTSVVLRDNSIFGNTTAVDNNSPLETVDARQNWWGGVVPLTIGNVDTSLPLASDPN